MSDAKCNFDVGDAVPIPTLPSCNTVSASTAVPASASEKIDKLFSLPPLLPIYLSENPKLESSDSPSWLVVDPSTLIKVTSLLLPPAPILIAVPLFSETSLIVEEFSLKSNEYAGASVPIPILTPLNTIASGDPS